MQKELEEIKDLIHKINIEDKNSELENFDSISSTLGILPGAIAKKKYEDSKP